jgi:hypothetical protein
MTLARRIRSFGKKNGALFGERIGIIGWIEQDKKDELTDQCVSQRDASYLATKVAAQNFLRIYG